MKDKKGNFYILDAILVLILVLMVIFIVNTVISTPDPLYSDTTKDFKTSQDIMETLSGKINFTDKTFIENISTVLKEGRNSKESISKVSDICEDKFDSMDIENYRFSETNKLNNKVLASNGNYASANNISVASRSYGEYFYTLSSW